MRSLNIPRKPVVIRASLVFLLAAFVELAQFFAVPLFGSTFDPLDLVMYAMGVTTAVGFEHLVFSPHPNHPGV